MSRVCETGLDPATLELELTESSFVSGSEELHETLGKLKDEGSQLRALRAP